MRQYEALNGIRGFAAISVLILHVGAIFDLWNIGAYLAVDLFFVLSGFVVNEAYDDRLRAGLKSVSFLTMRLKRFYFLYVLGLGLGAGIKLLDIVRPPSNISLSEWSYVTLFNTAFLPVPPRGPLDLFFPFNIPAWSLFFEIIVNVVFSLAIGRWTGKRLAGLIMACLLGLCFFSHPLDSINGGDSWATAPVGLFRSMLGFFMGVAVSRRAFHRHHDLPAWSAGLTTVLLGAIFLLPVGGGHRWIFDVTCAVLLFPAAVVVLAASRPSRFDPVMHWLGLISFPLYAIHFPILELALAISDKTGARLLVAASAFLVSLLAAFCAYFLDEWIRARSFRRDLR